jgi:5'-3' exoribonuclease 2
MIAGHVVGSAVEAGPGDPYAGYDHRYYHGSSGYGGNRAYTYSGCGDYRVYGDCGRPGGYGYRDYSGGYDYRGYSDRSYDYRGYGNGGYEYSYRSRGYGGYGGYGYGD